MKRITKLTNNPIQTSKLVLDDSSTVDFKLYFFSTQRSWYFDFKYKNIDVKGLKIVLGANILRSFKNIIPFGFAFTADKDIEPFALDDFETGRVSFFVLNTDDVQEIEVNVYNE